MNPKERAHTWSLPIAKKEEEGVGPLIEGLLALKPPQEDSCVLATGADAGLADFTFFLALQICAVSCRKQGKQVVSKMPV